MPKLFQNKYSDSVMAEVTWSTFITKKIYTSDINVNHSISCKEIPALPNISPELIPYKAQQHLANSSHNNECFFHNVFATIHMLLRSPSVCLANMRENIGPIPGVNLSRNGGIDPIDARAYLRPFYQRLFARIFDDMNPKAAVNVAPHAGLFKTAIAISEVLSTPKPTDTSGSCVIF